MIHTESVTLLNNASVTGPELLVKIGGQYNISTVGTFGGATLQLQFLGPDDATFLPVTGASFTANGSATVNVASGARVRMLITGSPTAMFSRLTRVGG